MSERWDISEEEKEFELHYPVWSFPRFKGWLEHDFMESRRERAKEKLSEKGGPQDE